MLAMEDKRTKFLQTFQFLQQNFNQFLISEIFPLIELNSHPTLAKAMIYSLKAGGKRIRPILTISSYHSGKPFNIDSINKSILLLACATEMIHTYSLIHDDLPSMDDDDLRRGIPTLHKQFSESTAILAGDALNSFGFYLCSLVESDSNDRNLISDLIKILHKGAGMSGMVSGQMEDLEMEGNDGFLRKLSLNMKEEILFRIHKRKTGELILASLLLGNRLRADHVNRLEEIETYGKKIGLLFQLTDDILDTEGSSQELGKTPGKDLESGKFTYISLYGLDESKKKRDLLIEELIQIGQKLESEEEFFFKNLPVYIGSRKN